MTKFALRGGHNGIHGARIANVTQRLLGPQALLWFGQTEGAALFLVIMGSLSDRLTGHLQTRNGRDAPIPRRLLRCSCE